MWGLVEWTAGSTSVLTAPGGVCAPAHCRTSPATTRGNSRSMNGCQYGELRQLFRGYAHDPVVTNDGFAASRGAGLGLLDEAGNVVRAHKTGRFSWGPPSLSVNETGDLIAWIRGRGDDKRLPMQSSTAIFPRNTSSARITTSGSPIAWSCTTSVRDFAWSMS